MAPLTKVLVTSPVEPPCVNALARFAEIVIAPDRNADTIRRLAADVEGIVACSPVPSDIFKHAPRLRALVRHGAGYDIIPYAEALARGIGVAYVPGANAQSVAEHALGAMFEVSRRFRYLDRDLRERGWDAARASATKPSELSGKRVGIVGLGAIGSKIAHAAHAGLGMQVVGFQRDLDRLPRHVAAATLDDLFTGSDFVVLCCPLTAETRHIVNATRLQQMRPSAFLVNVARGGLVDEQALVLALQEGRIAGAALDVFQQEPLPPDHPLLIINLALLTPHVAGSSAESRARVGVAAADEMERLLSGRAPKNPVIL